MQVQIDVPQFPAFRLTATDREANQYAIYMRRFDTYAATVVAAQTKLALQVAATRSLKDEIAEVKGVAKDMTRIAIDAGPKFDEKLAGVVETVTARVLTGVTQQMSSAPAAPAPVVVEVEPPRGRWYASNKRKKQRAAASSEARDRGSVPSADKVVPVVQSTFVGAFSECSDAVREDLRESRARMLVKQNELNAAKAEAEKTRVEAQNEARVIERTVEVARLKQDGELRKMYADRVKSMPAGFAETVASEGLETDCSVPSLSTGSVSPSSSISVAELERLRSRLSAITEKQFELTVENKALREKLEGRTEPTVQSEKIMGEEMYSRWSVPGEF